MPVDREDRDLPDPRQGIPQQLEALSSGFRGHVAESGHVPTWPRQACDKPLTFWIGHGEEDDRYRGCGLLDAAGQLVRCDDDRIRLARDEFLRRRCHLRVT